MKLYLKRISLFLTCFTVFVMLVVPFQVEANTENSGRMQLKIERIEQDKEQEYKNVETELDKQFPELFKKETNAVIQTKLKEKEASMEQLEHMLFTADVEADSTIKDTKESLFNEDYTPPKTSTSGYQEEEDNAGLSKVLYTGLAGVASTLCVVIYGMMRRFSD